MIAIGVARTKAHGHAMMSTAIAFTRACASAGCGPTTSHAMKVMNCGPRRRRAQTIGLRGRQGAWMGARVRCGLAYELDDARQQGFGADALGAH